MEVSSGHDENVMELVVMVAQISLFVGVWGVSEQVFYSVFFSYTLKKILT